MFMLSNGAYDVAKKLVQVVLPAIGALYYGLGQIWGFPEIENVIGSITVVAAFLGTILGISHSNYKNSDAAFDGSMLVTPTDDGRTIVSMEINGEPDAAQLNKMGEVRFKVKDVPLEHQIAAPMPEPIDDDDFEVPENFKGIS